MANEVEFGAYELTDKKPSSTGVKPPEQSTSYPQGGEFGVAPLTGQQRDPNAPMEAKDVAFTALTNVPSSAYEFGKSIVHPIMHPVETGQALSALGKGLYSKAAGAFGAEQDPTEKAQVEAPVEAVWEHLKNRYGGVENIKRTIASDPVGAAADASMFLTLGSSVPARVPGVIGTVGKIAQKTGAAIDPISVTAKAASTVPQATAFLTSWKSGTSYRGMSDAAKAGAELNPDFIRHATGAADPQEVVTAVNSALAQKQMQASAEYRRGMSQVASQTPLDYTNVLDTLDAQRSRAASAGNIETRRNAAEALREVESKINEFRNQRPHATAHTITDFDDMKKAIDDIAFRYKTDPIAHGAVMQVRNSIYNTIEAADPRYAKIMEKYGAAANEIREITQELAGGRRDTVAAKLRKMLKNRDASTRKQLLDALTEINPNIPYMLAGIEAHSVLPHGVRGALTSVGLGLGANPLVGGATLPLVSPRVSGGVQYGIGAVTGVPGQIEKRVPLPVRAGAYGSGETAQILNEDREQHRAGGRVGSGVAESLMRAADRAKRELGKQTETLLNAPDEHIAKALDIAKRHI